MSKERFLRAFANLPTDEQDQVIVIINARPINWKRAYDEVIHETELGHKILKKLKELELL